MSDPPSLFILTITAFILYFDLLEKEPYSAEIRTRLTRLTYPWYAHKVKCKPHLNQGTKTIYLNQGAKLPYILKILKNAYFPMKLTQNEVINIWNNKFWNFSIDDVIMTSLWRHTYVIFHIFRAKIENVTSLEQCKLQKLFIHRWKAYNPT